MATKKKTHGFIVPRRGPEAVLRRSGAGTHGDRRTKRQRDRGAQKRAAIREAVSW